MKCFEVSLNGGEPIVVGVDNAELLRGSFVLASFGSGGVVFSANVNAGPARSETRQWLSSSLAVGDEVRVRVIESDQATQPMASTLHGTAVDPESPDLGCSACRRSKSTVNQLLAVGAFSICDECVELCYESLGRRAEK